MLDANLQFDPKDTAITATAVSTNVLDFLVNRDPGAGVRNPLEVHVILTQAFTAAGAATLQIALQGSTDNSTFLDMVLSPVIAKASLVLGALVFRYPLVRFQLNETTPGRYYRLNYTVATGPFTAGKVWSYVSAGGDRNDYYVYDRNYAVTV